jgi:hypothetical protein
VVPELAVRFLAIALPASKRKSYERNGLGGVVLALFSDDQGVMTILWF